MTVHVHENDISYSPKNYQDGGSDEEGSAGDGEEDPIDSEDLRQISILFQVHQLTLSIKVS